MSHFLWFTM